MPRVVCRRRTALDFSVARQMQTIFIAKKKRLDEGQNSEAARGNFSIQFCVCAGETKSCIYIYIFLFMGS